MPRLLSHLLTAFVTVSLSLTSVTAIGQTDDNKISPPEPISRSENGDQTIDNCEIARQVSGRFKSITEIQLALTPVDRLIPTDCSNVVFLGKQDSGRLDERTIDFHWEATNFFHQPLYFDDTPLERYGQSLCPVAQPAISGTRFWLTFPTIPYKISVDRTHDCISTLGLYRPGECVPCTRETLLRGDSHTALFQAASTVGLIFLLP